MTPPPLGARAFSLLPWPTLAISVFLFEHLLRTLRMECVGPRRFPVATPNEDAFDCNVLGILTDTPSRDRGYHIPASILPPALTFDETAPVTRVVSVFDI